MTQNEQNFINKINEMQNIIELQKKAISERDAKIEELSTKKPKDSEKCDYRVAKKSGGQCSSLCNVSDKFFWNEETKLCQIKDEFRYLLKQNTL